MKVKWNVGAVKQQAFHDSAAAVRYTREVATVMVTPHLLPPIVDTVRGGGTVEVGGLRLGPDGISTGKHRVKTVRWASASNPSIADGMVTITGGGTSVSGLLGAPNSFLLDAAVPTLRALLG